ncbi:Zn-dependent hydrolase [Pseudohalocynthiibacter sp. F2068]|jgi:beta-ureidopropionase / N-carbamoyl-L-amino-acid hydrolase|uniref:Zn-dependent hydrolase n=1 Tax=Pseudohalocynthiibacter sp. F2068 TaxID=2926418 RepID=UPI001FF23099|nr:Zn-dependent hydrolase [Pseudohalocynthiibacter sp. F2068]MCK0104242.1 Zn-dependent hydrolase [Pseudohalocynthiibacter sp. F2068]
MNKPVFNGERLLDRLKRLGEKGALHGGGVCRLALTDADKAGRDLLVRWMKELGLEVSIDKIGNIWGIREGIEDGPPVMIGSHIDSVATGGLYDGVLGVMAGLEVVAALNDADLRTQKPLAVGAFTNEEGARFAPDMLGSGVHQGALDLDECLATVGIDGTVLGEELERIGYAGNVSVKNLTPAAFLEYHVEQGPVLEQEGIQIGAVTGVQGISWTEYTVTGQSNHAGTTPMAMRHDAGVVAARIACEARAIADEFGPPQVSTVGTFELNPNLVNVVPLEAKLTVDLRNTDNDKLIAAETRLAEAAARFARDEGCKVEARTLARFDPVEFDDALVSRIEQAARDLGHSVRRMPSGAGHDAQMFAPNCPTAMVFVPSAGGLSHNIAEHTEPDDLTAGGRILLNVALELLGE